MTGSTAHVLYNTEAGAVRIAARRPGRHWVASARSRTARRSLHAVSIAGDGSSSSRSTR